MRGPRPIEVQGEEVRPTLWTHSLPPKPALLSRERRADSASRAVQAEETDGVGRREGWPDGQLKLVPDLDRSARKVRPTRAAGGQLRKTIQVMKKLKMTTAPI